MRWELDVITLLTYLITGFVLQKVYCESVGFSFALSLILMLYINVCFFMVVV